MDEFLLAGVADWLVNLSAGWFAAAFIVSATGRRSTRIRWGLLTYNLIIAIVTLLEAIQLRRSLGVL
jgi:hypothetical protein